MHVSVAENVYTKLHILSQYFQFMLFIFFWVLLNIDYPVGVF